MYIFHLLLILFYSFPAVNGNYTHWSSWSDCSRTCGGGSQFRLRDCINPLPEYGGRDCAYYGARREITHCNPQPCPSKYIHNFYLDTTFP